MTEQQANGERPEGIEPYDEPAGGWGALRAVAAALKRQQIVMQGARTLLKTNQPDGFDCPGCAWPDPAHTSSFEFCENGAKAVTWESTAKRVAPDFFDAHSVADLWSRDDHWLEDQGRLTHPLRYDAATDRFRPVAWDDAFAIIARTLKALPDPNMAEFYTSGRASNEAAFMYQLFVRLYGTNNFPDCSNMCHEPTSVGLPHAIGVGKGTVTLEDFDHCDVIISIGHNPGTNHPRMMSTLRAAARRGVPIVVINPLRERALERFEAPQNPVEMATFSATRIASTYFQVRVGGDAAVLKGVIKALIALDDAAVAEGRARVLDVDFIAEHTNGYEALAADARAVGWEALERASGLPRAAMEYVADLYAKGKAVIICYGMGITQHSTGTANVQQMANLLLLRGNIGRPGAGIAPLRGHSNVQGDRTVGISEMPPAAFLDKLGEVFGFAPPRAHGHSVVEAIAAMRDGRARALISLGGNLAMAAPDPETCFRAIRGLDLNVTIATKLNRTQLLTARETLILPCLGRTEQDMQAGGPQSVTVEDSMSMVHASRGFLTPASPELRSETAIIAGIARATVGAAVVDWDWYVADYSRIRDKIEAVLPDQFRDFNARLRQPGGFRLPIPAGERVWKTPSGRAEFHVFPGIEEDEMLGDPSILRLSTLRAHDQYNTTIYSLDDRYRGVFGRRDVLLMNPADIAAHGMAEGDVVDLVAAGAHALRDDGTPRRLCGLTLVAYAIPRGCCGAYYPEAQPLVALEHIDGPSKTPSYKSVPVRVVPGGQASGLDVEVRREGVAGRVA